MKKDWLHIKFADAFFLNMGKTPARAEASYWTDGIYPWVSISDLSGDKFITHTKEQISQKAVDETNIHLVPKGTVIMSFKLSIGKTAIAPFDLYTNEAIMAFEPKPEISIVPDFLYYYLQYYKWSGNRAVMGETINKAVISNSYADIPPLSIQRSIVAELDLLHSVISKKKDQLRELDNLAQSLFYQMFGDPITNPMGWEIKKLGEVGNFARGVSKHRPRNAPELLGGDMPLIQTGDISNSGIYIQQYTQTYSELGVAQSKIWEPGTLCITIAANIGKASILTFKACFPDSIVGFQANHDIAEILYMYFVFSFLQSILEENAPAVAQKNINLQILSQVKIPLPPLSLQQSFAAKVSAIEAQKQAITQSIHHTEALLAQRMDNYFGI